jgi:cation:H+ antiporter
MRWSGRRQEVQVRKEKLKMLESSVWILGGLALLIVGAESLVRGAARLALRFGVQPLVVGLTIVSMGTGSPEVAISLQSAIDGETDLAVGNVVGSNIFNVLGVLGLSALFAPLVVSRDLIRQDVPVMIGASALLLAFSVDGLIRLEEGVALIALLVVYVGWLIRQSRRTMDAPVDDEALQTAPKDTTTLGSVVRIVVGLAGLVIGAGLLVDGAVDLASALGVSEVVIGLTIVAVGTSMPELVTSVVAAVRGEREIAVGNVIGSNIFNIFGVLGVSVLAAPSGIPVSREVLTFDVPVMLAVAVACLPVFLNGHRIGRTSGGVFALYYAAYTAFLVLTATANPNAPLFGNAMLWFVAPLTALTLAVSLYRSRTKSRRLNE